MRGGDVAAVRHAGRGDDAPVSREVRVHGTERARQRVSCEREVRRASFSSAIRGDVLRDATCVASAEHGAQQRHHA